MNGDPGSPGDERGRILAAGSVLTVLLLALSGVHPHDRATWTMEVFPVLVGLPILCATHRRFPLTSLLYFLLFAHALVLMLGGYYTYARVPLGFWIAKLMGARRNPYDKIGHFFQGLVPAIMAREIFLRGGYIRGDRMRGFLVVCVVLAISATYELIEWAAAMAMGQGADQFLGTQGNPWDTQTDMLFALIGGTTALLVLSRWHDRQLRRYQCANATRSPLSLRA